jgi:predicted PurR-regulated permease PerM
MQAPESMEPGRPIAHEKPVRSRRPEASWLEKLGSLALVILAAGGLGGLLYIGHAAFVPVAFSVLFALVLSSPVEALHRHGMPRSLGATLILILVLAIAGLTLRAVLAPARAWLAAIPHTIEVIEHKVGPVARVMERRYPPSSTGATETSAALVAEELEMSASRSLLVATPSIVACVVTIVILTLFLLTGGAPMTARLAGTLLSEGKSVKALHIIEAVRSEVGRYYVTIALINLGLGAATAGVTMLLQLPNPLLWGTMATLLNFLPYVGSTITLLVLTVVSIATFDSIGRVIAVFASFLILVTIEGQIVEPLLVGRRLKLSPIVVLLSLWFGGWFWGISGVVLAIPFLVAFKVVAEHIPNGKILAELLSPTPRKRLNLMRRRSSAAACPGRARGEP